MKLVRRGKGAVVVPERELPPLTVKLVRTTLEAVRRRTSRARDDPRPRSAVKR